MERCYLAIDLKSFYASVECVERGLDPLDTNLVVADLSRTEKTICLAVTPSLKTYGIPGRARLFEVVQKVREINAQRLYRAPGKCFSGKSHSDRELKADSSLELDYLVAPPRMAHYMEYSTRIYGIYLRYAAPEDIHVYSIDEIFMDATDYLRTTGLSAREFAMTIILDVLHQTGITATAGIGSNLYLAKIAMDIEAKHIPPDENGVRIAELTERSYREKLWSHRPLTDFWRVGPGIAKKLEENDLLTMGDVARCSLGKATEVQNADFLYRLFGVNAELLIDHAWGWEPCTIAHIRAYKPENHSLNTGQVLQEPYDFAKGRVVVREMSEMLALDLLDKGLVCDQVGLTVGYGTESLRLGTYQGEVKRDHYGRAVPKHGHGTERLGRFTSSARLITEAILKIYDRAVDPALLLRRLTLAAENVIPEGDVPAQEAEQLSLFADSEEDSARSVQEEALDRERRRQETVLHIKKKYGKNAILKGTNFEDGATARERNRQIGGHKA